MATYPREQCIQCGQPMDCTWIYEQTDSIPEAGEYTCDNCGAVTEDWEFRYRRDIARFALPEYMQLSGWITEIEDA